MLNTRSTIQNKILNYFFLNQEKQVYINELARQITADPKNVYRILVRLEGDGILVSEFKGKERYFSSNRKNPIYKNYKAVFLKTAGLEVILKRELTGIANLKEAYIFGSYASKKYDSNSDIDLLCIGKHKRLAVQKSLYDVQKKIGREINAVHMTPDELREHKAAGDQFVNGIFKGAKIKLI